LIVWYLFHTLAVLTTLDEPNSASGILVAMEAWDGKAQLDSTLHQAAVVALAGCIDWNFKLHERL